MVKANKKASNFLIKILLIFFYDFPPNLYYVEQSIKNAKKDICNNNVKLNCNYIRCRLGTLFPIDKEFRRIDHYYYKDLLDMQDRKEHCNEAHTYLSPPQH
ncbi:hypothetical protein SDC9_155979 [bioreactor metagenome]|uniref:Uncharacterized protein n=1 Tax=bioreactor metagenome TaxID=1076179 RepID=A0A645F7X3_9ZZZZ